MLSLQLDSAKVLNMGYFTCVTGTYNLYSTWTVLVTLFCDELEVVVTPQGFGAPTCINRTDKILWRASAERPTRFAGL